MKAAAPSEAVQHQLVTMLYNQTGTLIVGGLALPAAAVVCWFRTGEYWYIPWSAAMLAVLALRCCLQYAYQHRGEAFGPARPWRRRFTAGAWLSGALWGGAAVTIVERADPLVQLLIISVETVIIMGAAARNSWCPLAARGQTALGLAPLFGACLLERDPYYWAYSVFMIFALYAALTIVHHLYDLNVRFLHANEQNVALVNEVQQANLELECVNLRLERAATTDSLTEIANRRQFDTVLAEETRRAQREHTQLALLMLDIDAFKGYNDLYGHQAGDECLQRVAAALSLSFRRPGDLVARYGGEEFAAILPRTESTAAFALAETVRCEILALELCSAASPGGVVSVSIGVASFDPVADVHPDAIIRSADEALYAAKAAGRNCVRFAARPAVPLTALGRVG